jgi:hypothetical protein
MVKTAVAKQEENFVLYGVFFFYCTGACTGATVASD